jgi:hypothetical protein
MSDERDLDRFIDEVRARQRNIVFPDTVRNGRAVDAFFWNGSPNPTLVQRIAAWIFGLVFMGSGLLFLPMAAEVRDAEHSWIGAWVYTLIAVLFILGGIKVFRNGFARPTKTDQQPEQGADGIRYTDE